MDVGTDGWESVGGKKWMIEARNRWLEVSVEVEFEKGVLGLTKVGKIAI